MELSDEATWAIRQFCKYFTKYTKQVTNPHKSAFEKCLFTPEAGCNNHLNTSVVELLPRENIYSSEYVAHPMHHDQNISCADENKFSFICTVCQKTFSTRGNLKVHSRIHTDCTENAWTFEIEPNMKRSVYKCLFCSHKTLFHSHMQNHIRIRTNEKPYNCEVCNKSFNVKGNYTVHKRIHTGELPFKCDICGLKFRLQPRLKRHLLEHRIH
ncbi:zinc finger protein 282 [Trichonephila clavipes]|nr:zinc finger protein 282 [Trichonephila clavipes]